MPAPPATQPLHFSMKAHGARWDFVLTRGEKSDGAIFRGDARAQLVARDDAWRLYSLRGGR
jgi:hypothetical protein